jgi:hypothetical protein
MSAEPSVLPLQRRSRAPHEPEPGDQQDRRAFEHRRVALEQLQAGEHAAALTHAVLALEARVEEMTCFIARAG